MNKEISLYIHWPFCINKCPYCNFVSEVSVCDNDYDVFALAILENLKFALNYFEHSKVVSVFFGGGTPSLIPVKYLYEILNVISKYSNLNCNAEITLEANPGAFCRNTMVVFREIGINRLSLGIQSFFTDNLKFLCRTYDANCAHIGASIVAELFDNYSFDFMYGYDSQTMFSLEQDLKYALEKYAAPHLSCYQLTFEEGTKFFQTLQTGAMTKINDILAEKYYFFIDDYLKQKNIFRYEVSNYCKNSFESIHNLRYWQYKNYLGIGPSASGRIIIDGTKFELCNCSDIQMWLLAPNDSRIVIKPLSVREELSEYFIVGLRTKYGVDLKEVSLRFGDEIVTNLLNSKDISFMLNNNVLYMYGFSMIVSDCWIIKINSIIEKIFDVIFEIL